MRPLLLCLLLPAMLGAAESPYPLWDGQESAESYAKRINLPPKKTMDLGNGVKIELVLIPAGEFKMGTGLISVDEDHFRKQIVLGKTILAASVATFLVVFGTVIVIAIRQRRRPRYSLSRLLAMTLIAAVGVWGSVHWWQSMTNWDQALLDFNAARAAYADAYFTEKPAHNVTISAPLYLSRHPVTKEQYCQVLQRNTPSTSSGFAVNVSWNDAQEFCSKLSSRGEAARLPSDAEWEFACRAGTTTAYYAGNREKDLTRCVEKNVPNSFGLYEMQGFVWQWCEDWYGALPPDAALDPHGPASGTNRILRGGTWQDPDRCCRSAYRMWHDPGTGWYDIGFRVAVTVAKDKSPQ